MHWTIRADVFKSKSLLWNVADVLALKECWLLGLIIYGAELLFWQLIR